MDDISEVQDYTQEELERMAELRAQRAQGPWRNPEEMDPEDWEVVHTPATPVMAPWDDSSETDPDQNSDDISHQNTPEPSASASSTDILTTAVITPFSDDPDVGQDFAGNPYGDEEGRPNVLAEAEREDLHDDESSDEGEFSDDEAVDLADFL